MEVFNYIVLIAISVLAYFIGKYKGMLFVTLVFKETIIDIEKEQEEYQQWVENGKKVNEVPAPKFGLTALYIADKAFQLKQEMGESIKSLYK